MTLLRFQLRFRTTLGSLLQADTIFGHLMYHYLYRHGEAALKKLLDEFGQSPKFVISDGFPAGYLPRPRLSLSSTEIRNLEELVGQKHPNVDPQLVLSQILRKVRKSRYVTAALLSQMADDLSMSALIRRVIEFSVCPLSFNDPACKNAGLKQCVVVDTLGFDSCVWTSEVKMKSATVIKNTVNRIRSSGSGIHGHEEHFWSGGFDVYASVIDPAWVDPLKELFTDLELTGYGKKKSSGKGNFKIVSVEEVKLPAAASANAFVALSAFVPAPADPTDGTYGIMVKRGKIGEWFPRFVSPHKRPVIMIEAGSTFRESSARDYYGSFLRNVHFDPVVRHYAYALPMHVRIAQSAE